MRHSASLGRGLMAAVAHAAALSMQRARATGRPPMAVTEAEVRALASDFRFSRRLLPASRPGKTGIAASRRAARKLRNQRRAKRHG